MAQWMLVRKGADFEGIGKQLKIDPVIVRIMKNRGLNTVEEMNRFLNGTLSDLHSGSLMKDMEKACCLLLSKIGENKKIRVLGDYDIDGVNATYILVTGLRTIGALVDAVIPNRIKDGYGLNEHLIAEAKEAGVDTILTCDNGISASEASLFAKELGMTVIITDHHEVPYTETACANEYRIPEAMAVVDPKQPDCSYPYPNICGAFVAYKLIMMITELAGTKEEIRQNLAESLLENCALATVGDVMELKDENRIAVKYGMERMSHSSNMGIRALIETTGLYGKEITAYHLGFVIGPCLNASGRLDSAHRALDLLMAKDCREAAVLASELKELNESRKNLTVEATEKAVSIIESSALLYEKVLVIYLDDCHESLAGIIAGRLRERYERPVFVVTNGETMLKGSGRSVDSYHMYDEMSKIADVFERFGGHKGAAGFSLQKNNLELMRRRLNENCMLTLNQMQNKIKIDAEMPFNYVSLSLLEQLRMLEPFGNGNEKPLFARKKVRFIEGKILGKNRNMAKYQIEDSDGKSFYLIHFGTEIDRFQRFLQDRFQIPDVSGINIAAEHPTMSVLYYPSLNEYMGHKEIQFIMRDFC